MQNRKKLLEIGRRANIITEYRQTGGDADGDGDDGSVDGEGIGIKCWGWVQNILPCHPLFCSDSAERGLCG